MVLSLFPPPLPRTPTGNRRAGWTPFPTPRLRLGRGIIASIVLHLAVLLLLLHHFPASREVKPVTRPNPIQIPLYLPPPPKQVELPYHRPPPAPEPPPLPAAAPLTEGPDQTPGNRARVTPTPDPTANAQPDAVPKTAASDQTASRSSSSAPAPTPKPSPADAHTSPAPPPDPNGASAPPIVTEAQRIFARPSMGIGGPAGERDVRPWETTDPSASQGCTVPEAERDTTVPEGMAAISGRIYREDNHKPLAGARLQILGTPYGAFTDSQGNYRLVFERSLVNRCRSQIVRVSAAGYEGRDVTLFIGAGSTDVPLRRF